MKKIIFIPTIALLSATLSLGYAHAQTPDNSMDNAATPDVMTTDAPPAMATGMMDESMTTGNVEEQLLIETAGGSVYDRATAELAVQKAHNKNVQRYALRLMDDHNRLNKMLLMQANKRGLILPLLISDDDQSKLQTLMDVGAGREFDVAYLKEAIRINADDVLKANAAIEASSDKDFRGLMKEYAVTEQKHLDSASQILSGLQKNSPALNLDLMNGKTN